MRIINRHTAHMEGSRVVGHVGVDFRKCYPDQMVIAIADGFVESVMEEVPGDENATGLIVSISHKMPAGTGRKRKAFWYAHLKEVRVKERDFVRRGEVIGQFWSSPDGGWIDHVHLEYAPYQRSLALQDPLPGISVCWTGSAAPGELVFPVQCDQFEP